MREVEVRLPVGIEQDGTFYRDVVIAEMNGYDEENLTSKKVRNNGSKAQTILLQRCVQEIKGLVKRKGSSNELLPAQLFKKMMSFDRDFLFFEIRKLSTEDIEPSRIEYDCQECGERNEHEAMIDDLPVYEWPEEEPLSIEVEFLKPLKIDGQEGTSGRWFFLNGKAQEILAGVPSEKTASKTIAMCLREVGGNPVSLIEEDARRLSSSERNYIFEQVIGNSPGLDLNHTMTCEYCGAETTQILDISRFFDTAAKLKKNVSPQPKRTLRKLRKG